MQSRVLLVDDDIDLVDTLVRLLGRFGYKCRTASSGADAIREMETESPDVVVTDIHMSGADGLAVARHAREHRPPIPVILMTAYPTRHSHRAVHQMGGTIHLAKPFANVDFVNAVQRALEYAPSQDS